LESSIRSCEDKGLVEDVPSAGDLVRRVVSEAEAVLTYLR
jgi:hypothetical protein